jgi:AcrR family transcriptional regulator
MPRSELDNRRIRDARQERILQGALGLFASSGPFGTSSAEIAAAAGVSHGLVYHYFPSKEAVYVALVRRAMEAAVDLTSTMVTAPGSPWERLRTLCTQMLTGIRGAPEYTVLILQTAVGGIVPEEARAVVQEHSRHCLADLTVLIELGQAAGEVTEGDAGELARLLFSIVLGCVAGSTVAGLRQDALPMADTVLRVLRPLTGTSVRIPAEGTRGI